MEELVRRYAKAASEVFDGRTPLVILTPIGKTEESMATKWVLDRLLEALPEGKPFANSIQQG